MAGSYIIRKKERREGRERRREGGGREDLAYTNIESWIIKNIINPIFCTQVKRR